ncbi:6-phospho-3-hexuloisomerase [Streptomyces sp. NPDC001667]
MGERVGGRAGSVRSLGDGIALVVAENSRLLERVGVEQAGELARVVLSGARLFFAGEGRSGLVARMAAMRCVHLGCTVHVVGDATTPAAGSGDWLIVVSGSGASQGLRLVAAAGERAGARILAVTADPVSPLARCAQAVVTVPAAVKTDHSGTKSDQFAGSLFEQSVLLLMDAVFWSLSGRRTPESLWATHANLE